VYSSLILLLVVLVALNTQS